MKLELKNGNCINTIGDGNNNLRGKRSYISFVYSFFSDLKWYQKLYLILFGEFLIVE